MVASNARLSQFISEILAPLVKDASTTCESTEDLLASFQECNRSYDLEGCVIGSMDVEALYPSLEVDFAAKICGDKIRETM